MSGVNHPKAYFKYLLTPTSYELENYMRVLRQKGLIKNRVVCAKVCETDVSDLDGQAVMALLMKSVRDDRFCEGVFLKCFEDGSIKRWLTRLKEIDETSSDA